MTEAHDTGRRGEAIALRVAAERGWQPGRSNVRLGRGEADVVCFRVENGQRVGLLLEVKASRGRQVQAERVQRRQQQRLWRMAQTLCDQQDLARIEVAVVLVTLHENGEHIEWLDLEPF